MHMAIAISGPRVLLRQLREVMAEPLGAQERLDKIVNLIADNMQADVCSFVVHESDQSSVAVNRVWPDCNVLTN